MDLKKIDDTTQAKTQTADKQSENKAAAAFEKVFGKVALAQNTFSSRVGLNEAEEIFKKITSGG